MSSSSIENQLTELAQQLRSVERRLERLESRVDVLAPPAVPAGTNDSLPVGAAPAPPPPDHSGSQKDSPSTPPPPPVQPEAVAAEPEISLENRIGSLWLNRFGLVALLIGVVSLLLYSFQYFGAPLKIACGYVIGFAIVFFSRKIQMPDNRHWFSDGLNALGWSIAYFTGYAMYFIPGLQIVPLLSLELVCLCALIGGATYDAVRANSESTAVLGTAFASLSICLCASSINPFIGLLVILLATLALASRQRWHSLTFAATVAFHAAFLSNLWQRTPIVGADPAAVAGVFAGWLAVHAAVYFAKEGSPAAGKAVVLAAIVNAVAFAYLSSMQLDYLFPNSVWAHCILLSLAGIAYIATALVPNRQGLANMRSLNLLLGLFFLNSAKWIKFSGETVAVIDALQIDMLVYAGLAFELPSVRYFAVFLAITSLPNVRADNLLLVLLSTAALGGACFMHRSKMFAKVQTASELTSVSNLYYTLSNLVLANGIWQLCGVAGDWRGFFYLLQAVGNSALAIRMKDKYINGLSLVMIAVNGLYLLASVNSERMQTVFSVAAIFLAACYHRNQFLANKDEMAHDFKNCFAVLACLLLTWFVWSLPVQFISASLAAEGFVLVGAGFMLNEKLYRIAGLLVFALLGIHLLFFDLAAAPTITRIFSFIASGALLVGCSYAYAWFSKKMVAETSAVKASEVKTGDQPPPDANSTAG